MNGQHIPPPNRSSNSSALRAWRLLGRALRQSRGRSSSSAEAVLDRLLEASGCERAFVVGLSGEQPAVLTHRCRRTDGATRPSTSLLTHALAGRRVWVRTDRRRDHLLTAASVRGLELRFVASCPVRLNREPGALVLDSRTSGAERLDGFDEILRAFAGLLETVWPAGGVAEPTESLGMVGRSPCFVELLARTRRLASLNLPVLIRGETGSGKEGIARLLHHSGPRASARFVTLNCAALPAGLLESELFGAVRGAYTGLERDRAGLFRAAHCGTLFLDEIGEMAAPLQAKLLRVLQDGRIRPLGSESEVSADVRVVAATHRELETLLRDGGFRQDLYYRLAMIEIRVPALRERVEDIPLLVEHLALRLHERNGLPSPEWSPAALERLAGYHWPGNVRELEAVVARAALAAAADRRRVEPGDVPTPSRPRGGHDGRNREREMITSTLAEEGWLLTRAAARIGWSRQKLARRMTALGIPRPVKGLPGGKGNG